MASRNGRTVGEILTSGYRRTVQELSPGSLGVALPKEKLDEHGVEQGDELGIEETADGNLKVHLPDSD